MGEVYRAEDLTLDHPVALKFLPDRLAADESHLVQFHNELRIARQVSHKNVCQLYDLGEADGRRFLTMEFYGSVQTAFVVVLVFVGLRLVVRRTWIAVTIGVLLVTAAVMQNVAIGGVLWLHGVIQLVTIGIVTFAIFLFGLLVTTVMILVDNIPTAVPIVTHGPAWPRYLATCRSPSSSRSHALGSTQREPVSLSSAS